MHNPQIIWEDDAIIAVNKPGGLLTIADGYDASLPHLSGILQQQFGPIWIVHRLDKETSGVLIVARTAAAHKALNNQFEHRQVEKIYHALVSGLPNWVEMSVDRPLRVNGDRKHRTIVDQQNGKPAKTIFRVLERFENCCLIEARPLTGYTHQIRAHFFRLGLQIVGDTLYAPRTAPFSSENGITNNKPNTLIGLNRLGLHSCKITFIHPNTLQTMSLEAPYPEDFANALNALQIQHN